MMPPRQPVNLSDFLDASLFDVTQVSSQQWTALMTACKLGYLDEVKLLLKAGADFNIPDQVGYGQATDFHWKVVFLNPCSA